MTELEKRMIRILRMLPLAKFNYDPMDIDASEFVDYSSQFLSAMDAARELLAEIGHRYKD